MTIWPSLAGEPRALVVHLFGIFPTLCVNHRRLEANSKHPGGVCRKQVYAIARLQDLLRCRTWAPAGKRVRCSLRHHQLCLLRDCAVWATFQRVSCRQDGRASLCPRLLSYQSLGPNGCRIYPHAIVRSFSTCCRKRRFGRPWHRGVQVLRNTRRRFNCGAVRLWQSRKPVAADQYRPGRICFPL